MPDISEDELKGYQALERAAEEFIHKVDSGRARSIASYLEFKSGLTVLKAARMEGGLTFADRS